MSEAITFYHNPRSRSRTMTVKAIEPRPSFQAYFERLSKRPARQRAFALDEKLVEGLRAGG